MKCNSVIKSSEDYQIKSTAWKNTIKDLEKLEETKKQFLLSIVISEIEDMKNNLRNILLKLDENNKN